MELFLLKPEFFPRETRDWLSLDTILRNGMLPLGTKHGYRFFLRTVFANVGCLSPWDRARMKEVRQALVERGVAGVHFYRVQPDPFREILRAAYGVEAEKLKSTPELHPSLQPYTDSV